MKTGVKKHYAGVLDIPAKKLKGIAIRHVKKPAGWTTQSGTIRTAMFGQTSEKLVFKEPTVWHELSEKGRGVWMTDLPIEQRQTDELLVRSHGRVLVGGLGLGYAVVALAARKKVKEIVVIESNATIIKLVWEATVTRARAFRAEQTATAVKLTVIHADLFEFLKERQANKRPKPEFDWGLFDIWQGDGETTFHEVVVPLRALAHGVVASVVCWNEDVMRGQLLQSLETRLMMLTNPMFHERGITLDLLTTDSDNIWTQWAVPFWRWFKDHAYISGTLDEELVRLVMGLYVKSYGRPEAMNGVPTLRPYRSKVLTALTDEAAATV